MKISWAICIQLSQLAQQGIRITLSIHVQCSLTFIPKNICISFSMSDHMFYIMINVNFCCCFGDESITVHINLFFLSCLSTPFSPSDSHVLSQAALAYMQRSIMLANLQPQVGSFISYTARLCPNSFPIFLQTPLIFKLAWDGIFFLISLSEIVSYIRNAAKWPCHMIPLIQESWTF